MIDGKKVFDQPVKNDLITYEIIQKIATWQRDRYTAGYLLEYNYLKNYYEIVEINLTLICMKYFCNVTE